MPAELANHLRGPSSISPKRHIQSRTTWHDLIRICSVPEQEANHVRIIVLDSGCKRRPIIFSEGVYVVPFFNEAIYTFQIAVCHRINQSRSRLEIDEEVTYRNCNYQNGQQ